MVGITTIVSILSFIKKYWQFFLVIGLAVALFISTFYFRIEITRLENKVEKLKITNEMLVATNMLFTDQIKQHQKDIERLSIYSNSFDAISKSTNFDIPQETVDAFLEIQKDFFSNRYKTITSLGAVD